MKIKNHNNIVIHLDFTESDEIDLINEFLFSFLITNFYCTSGDILFIPFTNDIDIYIEIQNCFTNNYLSKFGILKLFDIINIKLDNIPKLDFPKTIIDTFKDKFGHIGLDTNEKIEEFIKNCIGVEKYSYYHINMFINFFLSQFNSYNGKVKFTKEGKDLTIQIIQDFSKGIQYFTKGCFSYLLLNKVNNQKEYIDLLSEIYSNDLDYMNFNIPIKIVLKEEMKFISLELKKNKLNNINQKDYLSRIKRMMNLKNEIDNDKDNNKSLLSILDYKTENYVITNDNFNKMILILYRIISNIPFIIMGETGCGKTLLITKLNQLINNGELLLEKININPDITDQIIYEEMKRINEKYNNTKEEIWVFFDNINTCQSFELINEIFINRTFFGEKLNENIRIMGACNPFRKTKNEFNNCLAYNVHPLPQSLLYYVFSFGFMNNEDEKDYIYDMVEKLFNKNKEEELHKFTADSIFECHKFLRSIYDYSVVSLKDVNRFIKCVEFFKKYYKLKEDIIQTEKLYKIKSIICSIYLCYYFRLDIKNRSRFDIALRKSLLKLVNYEENNNLKDKWEYSDLLEEIKYRDLKINLESCQVRYFSDIIKIEEDFLMDKIEINDDIYKNDLLKENIFILFISIVMKIPLRLFGKPNSGKTLSINLIIKTMKGKYSKNKFFQQFPAVIPTYFEGSENINKKDIKNAFQIAERKFKFYNEKQYIKNDELPFSLVIFDNMDTPNELFFESKNINYICISNNLSGRFNFSQINKGFVLQAKNFDDRIEVVIDTCKYIANTIGKHISKNN